jgi:hypothetical protein
MRNVSDKSCTGNQNKHFMNNYFFKKSFCLWDNLEKYCKARHATKANMEHEHCVLET